MEKSKPAVKKLGIIIEPTKRKFEEEAVFNPGCWQEGEFVHMFYRALDRDNKSSVGYAKLKGPTKVVQRWKKPIISREYPYESRGIEDPRIVKIDDTFYITYVAHDGKNAVTCLATSKNLKQFSKKGIITAKIEYRDVRKLLEKTKLKKAYFSCASYYERESGADVLFWGKDVIIFPKKINGKFAMLHRLLPGIQIVFFKKFSDLNKKFWEHYFRNLHKYTILENKYSFESSHIGGGCSPIETKDGWLIIFHATDKKKVYRASAALLDKKNPLKVIGRLKKPFFSPTKEWEKEGFVPNVVFPTGTAIFDDTLYIYYGAADKRIAVASIKIEKLLKELKNSKS